MPDFPMIGHFKDVGAFRAHVARLGIDLPADNSILSAVQGSPLAQPLDIGGFRVGNRWCIQPMEGWDGTTRGEPTDNTLRRWRHFGASGAKLIWGGEAFAVQADARGNPKQLALIDGNEASAERSLASVLDALLDAHRQSIGPTDELLVGLQLTHSGRFCRPNDSFRAEPRIAYHHPLLDERFGIDPRDDSCIVSDDYLDRLIEAFIACARIARRVGFHFVDVKHCHGYLGHELLSAFTRRGRFGGSFENRTRFARETVQGIKATCPGLMIGVRLSAFDSPPFAQHPASSNGRGVPADYASHLPYRYAFGCRPEEPLSLDLSEPAAFIDMLGGLGVRLLNISCGSPYYNPHIQRPAMYPPSDGYDPPEDPLIGVARQIDVVRRIRQRCPGAILVGSAYSYLQEYLPHVAQAVVRNGWTDFVGIGRLALSYWDLPADTLAGRPLEKRRLCRTFSDCTTAPRNGLMSGCYPLDVHYKSSPDARLLQVKKRQGAR